MQPATWTTSAAGKRPALAAFTRGCSTPGKRATCGSRPACARWRPRAYTLGLPCQRGAVLAGRCETEKRRLSAPARHAEAALLAELRAFPRGTVAAGPDHRPDERARAGAARGLRHANGVAHRDARWRRTRSKNAWPGVAASSWTALVNTPFCQRSHASSPTRSTPLAATRNLISGPFGPRSGRQ